MGLTSQLVLRGPFGYSETKGYQFSFTGRDAYTRALARANATVNLLALGNPEAGEGRQFGVTMQPRINFTDTTGIASTWIPSSGGTYLDDLPGPFGDGTAGLQYGLSNSGSIGEFFSGSNLVTENAPFAIRYRIPKIEQAYPVVTFQVEGTTGGLGFQVMIAKGKASMMLLTPSWTQARETTLFGWLAQTTIDDTTQGQIDARRKLIYTEETPINLEGRRNTYTEDHTLIFFPEANGAITCFDENFRFLGQLTCRDLIHDRTDGVMWTDSPLRVRSNGPAIDFQFGQWESPTRAQLRLGKYPSFTSGSWTFQTVVWTPTGTTCAMSNETISTSTDEVVIDFASSVSGVAPVFYLGDAVRYPSTRNGTGYAVVLDTDDLDRNPVMEAAPTFEPLHRRSKWAIDILDQDGAVTTAITQGLIDIGVYMPQADGAHLMCDWIVGGTTMIKNGIVVASGRENMRRADNDPFLPRYRAETKLCLTVADQWALADEFEFDLPSIYPVGDGLKLGAYLRNCFLVMGLETAAIANISATAGRKLPKARPGEKWLVQPDSGSGVTLGDWLRKMLDLFGEGRQLWIDSNGVWNFGFRSTTNKFAVASDGNEDRVFYGVASWNDSSMAANFFRVTGADGPNGLPLGAWWDVYSGYRVPATTGAPLYIGRRKMHPTVSSTSLVTQNDCNRAVRSLVRLYGSKPGKGWRVESFFVFDAYPGDYGTYDGVRMQLERIESGSIAFGSTATGTNDFKGHWSACLRVEG